MSNNCININNEVISKKYNEVYYTMKSLYYQQYNYLSTSVNIKLLGNFWLVFFNKNQKNGEELSCFVVTKMFMKDSFAFSIYKELHPNFITLEQALNDPHMNLYLDAKGLTDENLGYINAISYLGESRDSSYEQ